MKLHALGDEVLRHPEQKAEVDQAPRQRGDAQRPGARGHPVRDVEGLVALECRRRRDGEVATLVHRVQEIEDPLMQKIRYLDKLIDELAQGKAMEKILRQ